MLFDDMQMTNDWYGLSGVAGGYFDYKYSSSLSHIGKPLFLPQAGGYLLERAIPEARGFIDLKGPYPLMCLMDWSKLSADIEALERNDSFVTISLVTDPFGNIDVSDLKLCFPDICFPYKNHYFIDLDMDLFSNLPVAHKRNIKYAAKRIVVSRVNAFEKKNALIKWVKLYEYLKKRHNIHGPADFSERSFKTQFEVPGLIIYQARISGDTVGMLLWYVQNKIAYYHLAAYSRDGYESKASFALFEYSVKEMKEVFGLRWCSLGAGSGVVALENEDGLTRFKKGWATGTKTVYFCGRILNLNEYKKLVCKSKCQDSDLFPAYG